jgi:hypothetical protein
MIFLQLWTGFLQLFMIFLQLWTGFLQLSMIFLQLRNGFLQLSTTIYHSTLCSFFRYALQNNFQKTRARPHKGSLTPIYSALSFALFHFNPAIFNRDNNRLCTVINIHFLQNITYMVFNCFFTNKQGFTDSAITFTVS